MSGANGLTETTSSFYCKDYGSRAFCCAILNAEAFGWLYLVERLEGTEMKMLV